MDKRLHLTSAGKPCKRNWIIRGLIAGAAAVPILLLLSFSPASWWTQSGFESYPGTFVRVADDSYRLCRPWPRHFPQPRTKAAPHVTSRSGSVFGTRESNFAVLLPLTARVTEVYCAAAPPSAPLTECSVARCTSPVHAQIEDNIYTQGRGVIFSFRAKAAKPDQRTLVGFWVVWRDR